jgi:phosphatidylserine/phosphatidylglycerophosphate/cardiolipin synthase-like enzyme
VSAYLRELIVVMKAMDRGAARDLAHTLCVSASDALRSQKIYVEPPAHLVSAEVEKLCAKTPLTAEMACEPWQAYNLALHSEEEIFYALTPGLESLLTTIPIDYKLEGLPDRVVGPYADSLVAHLSTLIDRVENELLVVAPYWSKEGVSALRHRIDQRRRERLKVTILTAAELSLSDRAGLKSFETVLINDLGAQVSIFEPRRLDDGRYPLMHAKAMVSDRKYAYVGSANFSQNGLARSIETGVSLSATPALQLHEWFSSILPHFIEVRNSSI